MFVFSTAGNSWYIYEMFVYLLPLNREEHNDLDSQDHIRLVHVKIVGKMELVNTP